MNSKLKFLLSLLLCYLYVSLYGQQDTTIIIDKYFDQEELGTDRNVIKINVVPIINGEVSVLYERTLSDYITIEAGMSLLLPFYIPDLGAVLGETNYPEVDGPGFALVFFPKYYFSGVAPEYFFTGLQLKHREYGVSSGSSTYNDLTMHWGGQFFRNKKLLLEYNWGMGIRMTELPPGSFEKYDYSIAFPISFKFGYIF